MPTDRRRELVDKVSALVALRWGGSYRMAFDAMDGDKDGAIDATELHQLLRYAGVGTRLTRSAWGRQVMAELDADADGEIAWAEFEKVMNAR